MTYTSVLTFESIECATCSIPFGITADMNRRRRDDHARFYCPNGHINWYSQDSELERLRRDNASLARRSENSDARARMEQRAAAAARGQLTKTKNRIARGVCPCCNRSFPGDKMQVHIATQHPTYTEDAHADA